VTNLNQDLTHKLQIADRKSQIANHKSQITNCKLQIAGYKLQITNRKWQMANSTSLAKLDQKYVWHPFTQMRDWLRGEPIVIVEGRGAVLRDAKGREFLDANSSIWTNLHGHRHPKINQAIQRQLKKIAHSSTLGLANEPASLLAAKLMEIANKIYDLRFTIYDSPGQSGRTDKTVGCTTKRGPSPRPSPRLGVAREMACPARGCSASRRLGNKSKFVNPELAKVFFSDDGSTALEVALKLAYEFTKRTRGLKPKPRFLSLEGAYHGDTVGAVSAGHIDLFHQAYSGLLFKTDKVMSPYCYRCPFNRAKPERDDARNYRRCGWECVGLVEQKFLRQKKKGNPYGAFVFEPLMQGAAGMIPQPGGWLRQVAEIARGHGALLIADEVMTGFGRTGAAVEVLRNSWDALQRDGPSPQPSLHLTERGRRHSLERSHEVLFACHHEFVQPDFLCVAKGLTGGYLPMAATLTTQNIFDAFLGKYEEFKTFFHGHSFTGNQLGAAASLASLDILQSPASVRARTDLQKNLGDELQSLWRLPQVGDIRQVGLVAGIELVKDWRTREPFGLRERAGIRVCEAMARRGVLTRPVGNVIVLMPPYCTTKAQVSEMVSALGEAVSETLP
jgi:adenosylmethionine-8-amino-7-oxononanoate aminotransferase